MPLTSGSKLGPYEIQSALGAGGMGEVYRARDTRLDRTVAIKVLPVHLSSNAELNARFEREARAVSALNHPHICHLYDVGTQDGTSFLVMEYLDGETLADRLRKGPMPLKQALDYGIQIAEALGMAHRAGILHRDLKPQNVMLTAGGAKLLDFGLAKAAPSLGSSSASGLTPSTPTMTIAELTSPAKPLTRQGTVVGTFQYMAPEVLQGSEADARSDVFALGCVLYEMVTGRRPFEGKSQLSVMTGILEKDPEPVSAILPASPAALDHLVKSCLEKNPEERIQTAQDVKLQLKWLAAGGGAETVRATQGPAKRSPMAWILAVPALAVALISGWAYLRVVTHAQPVVRSSILAPPGTSFVTMAPASGPAVVAPDGSRLAFSARDEKGNVALYVRALRSSVAIPLPGTEEATYPFWSADGKQIAFFAQGKLKRIDAAGGPVQNICDAANGRGGAWNSDDVVLFTPSVSSAIFRVSASGGTPEPVSKLDLGRYENSHRWPYFLPDGQHFLFWARNSLGTGEQTLYAGMLGSMQPTVVLKGVTAGIYASGYLLFLRDQTLLAQSFDPSSLKVSGDAMPIAEKIAINDAANVPEFSASNTGVLVYQTGDAKGAWDLQWFTRDGKAAGSVAQQERFYYPSLSPDEGRVAVSLFNGSVGTANLWILDLRRGTKSRLTFGNGTQLGAEWSPDGKTLYYTSDSNGGRHIYARAADGSGSEQSVLNSPEASSEFLTNVTADGKFLVYTRQLASDPHKNIDIWALPLSGERKPFPVVQSPFNDVGAEVSPTGKWMAYHSNESGRNEVYVTAFPGGGAKWQVSTNGGADARWRGDGKELFFLDPSDNLMAVDVDPSGDAPRLGVPHPLFQAMGVQRQVGTYVVTHDGKRFLVNSGSSKQGSEPLTLVTNWTAELKK
jgi:Tol biopolymer transport system component